jgi:putative heme-binding domain-containing protein
MKWHLTSLLVLCTPAFVSAAPIQLNKGDHVTLIGNATADRMQHSGWLETLTHARLPQHGLIFRNLGYPGDEVGGYTDKPEFNKRLRSANFGSGDLWMERCKTDVIFAFFGYNESFAGKEGLDKFKADLDGFLKHVAKQKYNGTSAPRVVLFSPIAHEDLHSPNLPDGKANNERLKLYTAAMAEVAKANNVPFIDLFAITQAAYTTAKQPLTFNGIHLNEYGDRVVADAIDLQLAGGRNGLIDFQKLEPLRAAINDKNLMWFERYRTVDGYSIYGGRADEPKNVPVGQRNRAAMDREMEILDIMTANRDKHIFALAQGKPSKIDDSNTPPFVDVKTNKPGPLAGDTWPFLDGEEAIKKMTVAKGLKVELWADEKTFPELSKPVQMAFDAKGRMWVAAWPSYPHWKPKDEMNDKLLIFEDTTGKGKADKCTVFADHLHCPTGFDFVPGGVLVAEVPDIMLLKDTKGTGKADYRERVLHGMDSADTHHSANSFALDPGGNVYWQEGTFHHTQIETPYGPPIRNANAGVFRYEPRAQKFDVYITHGFANPHGHAFDHWGQDIVIDGTGSQPYHAALFSGHLDYPQKHPHPPQVYKQRARPCPGMEYMYSKHFPDEFWGNLLVADVIQFQGILRYKIEDDGASFKGTELEPILRSSDPNFRPSDLKIGPDGALYFIDWHNPIIGHLQHNMRDPNRDRVHGRIYRVSVENRPLLKPTKIDGEPIEKLLDLLKEPQDRVRSRARIELANRDGRDVMAALKKWVDTLDSRKDLEYEHHVLEALWLHQSHNIVDVELLKRVLSSPDFRARAAATRVLCYWRDRVPNALELLKKLADDQSPRVRLEAIRAASFFTTPEAIEVVFIASDKPTDEYLDYTRGETMKQLSPIFKAALDKGQPPNFTTESGIRHLLRSVTTEDLLKRPRTRVVNLELLYRPGVRDEVRKEALKGLAAMEKKPEPQVLLAAIHSIDEKRENRDESVVFDLVRLLTTRTPRELADVRGDIEKLALVAQQSVIRQIGFVALINIDGNIDKAWALGTKSVAGLTDLVRATSLIGDASVRASMYPKIEPLLAGLPAELKTGTDGKVTMGQYVRIEIPGRQKTLTLAEVEVMSDGKNIARNGKASQSSTAFGGEASRAIDGNKSGLFGDNGQTHTRENSTNPWWEVDLGAEHPIQSILIYNRTDGGLGSRLAGYTVQVIAKDHKTVVFEKTKNPAPQVFASHTVGGNNPERTVRAAAMIAMTSVRGQELKTFQTLAKLISKEDTRADAIHAIKRIDSKFWPKDDAKPLVVVLLDFIGKIPPQERTSTVALEAMEFADSLTTLLPSDEAKKVRTQLGELGVRVLRMGTQPERMSFDKDILVAKAGKPVEILFENIDLMPHNLVIIQPGSLEEIATIAEATGSDPTAAARNFVPKSNKVLLSSVLLQPREVQKLSFVAPKEPGVYPIVCTFPGHSRRMYAALYVVADLDEYLVNPEKYVESNPALTAKDALLKDRRPRTDWKIAELKDDVMAMEKKGGRSFNNGKLMFQQVATCVACHKLEGVGQEFGPDLWKLDESKEKRKLVDHLESILEPSAKIEDKYRLWIFNLNSGKTVTAMILEENGDTVKIIENPLAKAEPRILKKSEFDNKEPAKVSLMPKGLVEKLTKDEVLDLIAYVYSKGDKNHALFKGDMHDGHGHQH